MHFLMDTNPYNRHTLFIMTAALLDIFYLLAAIITSPVWLTRMLRDGKYRKDIKQRFGLVPKLYGLQPTIWIHGVSVGEINASRELVNQLHSQLPDFRIVISSTTDTGLSAAQKYFAPEHKVFRYPFDISFSVKSALKRIKPRIVIFMEGDIWPNFINQCKRMGIDTVIVNGRIGPRKGLPRYRLIRPLAARLFNSLTAICLQHEKYAEMFKSLGVQEDKLYITGMMKYDTAQIASSIPNQDALAEAMGIAPDDKLLVAGGTGKGEEIFILQAYKTVLEHFSGVKLAIVPRKPEQFEKVAQKILANGFNLIRRSENPDGSHASKNLKDAILLGDTIGDLRKFYSLSYAVFIGRSLVPEGGSDMIEAAALAKPVVFGPHTFNFPQADSMVEAGAAHRVKNADELAKIWCDWLKNPDEAARIGQKAQQFVQSQQGATKRNVEIICKILGRVPALSPGGIATDIIVQ